MAVPLEISGAKRARLHVEDTEGRAQSLLRRIVLLEEGGGHEAEDEDD
jgi:hypothetical protein